MNRNVIILCGALLLTVAMMIGFKKSGEKAGDDGGSPVADEGRQGGSKSGAGGKVSTSVTPTEALKRLRSLPDLEFAEAPGFGRVEALAERISTADLVELIEEMSFEKFEGLDGWLRCTLFAEWGRRDAEAAMAYLKDFPADEEGKDHAMQQAWFSLIRGLAERDANRALDLRDQFGEMKIGEWAAKHATVAVFKELAREDAGAAWTAVLEADESLGQADVLEGFFEGLGSTEEARQYLTEWNDQRWDTEESTQAYSDYNRRMQSNNSGLIATPAEETIAMAAATAWAQHDLEGAMEWMEAHGPGGERARAWRATSVLREWAKANPRAALELLDDERFSAHQSVLGYGIIEGDVSAAGEVLSGIENHSARSAAMITAVTSGGSNHVNDFFPTPGQPNRLPDFEGRYQTMLEAVRSGNFHERQERALLESLNREYRDTVPAAQAAHEGGRR